MTKYLAVFEYGLGSITVETIEFKSLEKFNTFDFEDYVKENYGNSTSYMCLDALVLNTKCKTII